MVLLTCNTHEEVEMAKNTYKIDSDMIISVLEMTIDLTNAQALLSHLTPEQHIKVLPSVKSLNIAKYIIEHYNYSADLIDMSDAPCYSDDLKYLEYEINSYFISLGCSFDIFTDEYLVELCKFSPIVRDKIIKKYGYPKWMCKKMGVWLGL